MRSDFAKVPIQETNFLHSKFTSVRSENNFSLLQSICYSTFNFPTVILKVEIKTEPCGHEVTLFIISYQAPSATSRLNFTMLQSSTTKRFPWLWNGSDNKPDTKMSCLSVHTFIIAAQALFLNPHSIKVFLIWSAFTGCQTVWF